MFTDSRIVPLSEDFSPGGDRVVRRANGYEGESTSLSWSLRPVGTPNQRQCQRSAISLIESLDGWSQLQICWHLAVQRSSKLRDAIFEFDFHQIPAIDWGTLLARIPTAETKGNPSLPQNLEWQPRGVLSNWPWVSSNFYKHLSPHSWISKDLQWFITRLWWQATLNPSAWKEGQPPSWAQHLRLAVDSRPNWGQARIFAFRGASQLIYILSQVVPGLNWPRVWPRIRNFACRHRQTRHRECAPTQRNNLRHWRFPALCPHRQPHITASSPVRPAMGAIGSLFRLDMLWWYSTLQYHARWACDAAHVSLCGEQP